MLNNRMENQHMNSPAPVANDYGDNLTTVEQFTDRFRHLYPNQSRVRYLLRERATNGLVATGAVLEVFSSGDERPKLFIHTPSWFAWMRAGGSHAPRRTP